MMNTVYETEQIFLVSTEEVRERRTINRDYDRYRCKQDASIKSTG